jgi:GNAT superfamily N-acetyltransferase
MTLRQIGLKDRMREMDFEFPLAGGDLREAAPEIRLSHVGELLRAHLFGPRPMAEVVLAERDGTPVGFALFFSNFSTFLGRPGLYLEDLYVHEHERGHGVGRKLLEHLARLAIDRGWGRMEWAVLDWNEPAIGFYQGLGARLMDGWSIVRVTGDALTALATQ